MKLPDRIETDRLLIRKFAKRDAAAFVEFMVNPDASGFLSMDPDQHTRSGAQALLNYIMHSYQTTDPVFALAIIDRGTNTFMGSCGFVPVTDESNVVECYFSLLPKYWGWGFATEATAALLYYAFEELGLEKVVADISVGNKRSFRVASNVGMKDNGPTENRDMQPARRYAIDKSTWFSDDNRQAGA